MIGGRSWHLCTTDEFATSDILKNTVAVFARTFAICLTAGHDSTAISHQRGTALLAVWWLG